MLLLRARLLTTCVNRVQEKPVVTDDMVLLQLQEERKKMARELALVEMADKPRVCGERWQ